MTATLDPTPAAPAAAPGRPLLRSARAELRRLLLWPVTWVLFGVWMALNLAFTYVFDWISYRTGDSVGPAEVGVKLEILLPGAIPDVLTQGMPMFGGALVTILGALAVGSGFGWGTWKTVLTQGPGRASAFGGTLLAVLALVVGTVLAMVGLDLVMSSVIAAVEGGSGGLPAFGGLVRSVAGGALMLSMWASLGVLVGLLARGPALSVGLGLVWSLVVENLLRGVAAVLTGLTVVTDHLPGSVSGSLAGALGASGGDDGGAPGVLRVLDGGAATLWTAGYLAASVVLSLLLARRRDLL